MKKFTLLLIVLLMVSFSAVAQEKLYVYQKDATCTEFTATVVDSIVLSYNIINHGEQDSIVVYGISDSLNSVIAQRKLYVYQKDATCTEITATMVDSIVLSSKIINSGVHDSIDIPDMSDSLHIPTYPTYNHEYVDLGLPSGTLWATCNVGANSPEEFGDYFAWGEIEPKTEYTWQNYKWCNGTSNSLNKYCTLSSVGTVDNITTLGLADDVASVKWGSNWRMPTAEEQKELCSYATWYCTYFNGVLGYAVISNTNGNSIFLPASGVFYHSDLEEKNVGRYWARDLSIGNNESKSAYHMSINCNGLGVAYYSKQTYFRFYGFSVRPVRVQKKQ